MTSWLTLSGDIRQKLTFNENSGIFARIFTNQWIKIYIFPGRVLTTWRGIARTLMSRLETRPCSLIIYIFVDCHIKQRIISVYEDTHVQNK